MQQISEPSTPPPTSKSNNSFYFFITLLIFMVPGILGQLGFMELRGYCIGYVGGRAKCTADIMELVIYAVVAVVVVWAWRRGNKTQFLVVLALAIVLGGWVRDGYRHLFMVTEHGLWADAAIVPIPDSARHVESWYPAGNIQRRTEFYTRETVPTLWSFFNSEFAERGWYCDTEYTVCADGSVAEGIESVSSYDEASNRGVRTIIVSIYAPDSNGNRRVLISETDYRLVSGITPY